MNRKRKISGLMSLILLLAMLDGAFFPQILRLMPDTENSWQLSAALLRVTMQDCRPESEHAQVLRGTAGSESGTEIVTVRLRLLFDLLFLNVAALLLFAFLCLLSALLSFSRLLLDAVHALFSILSAGHFASKSVRENHL